MKTLLAISVTLLSSMSFAAIQSNIYDVQDYKPAQTAVANSEIRIKPMVYADKSFGLVYQTNSTNGVATYRILGACPWNEHLNFQTCINSTTDNEAKRQFQAAAQSMYETPGQAPAPVDQTAINPLDKRQCDGMNPVIRGYWDRDLADIQRLSVNNLRAGDRFNLSYSTLNMMAERANTLMQTMNITTASEELNKSKSLVSDIANHKLLYNDRYVYHNYRNHQQFMNLGQHYMDIRLQAMKTAMNSLVKAAQDTCTPAANTVQPPVDEHIAPITPDQTQVQPAPPAVAPPVVTPESPEITPIAE